MQRDFSLIRAPERLKSSPSCLSCPSPEAPVLAVAGKTRTPEGQHPRRLKPSPRWVPGNSGNSGNFLAGSTPEK